MNNEVSYCTSGLWSDYLGGDSHGKHRPWLVGFWLVLDLYSHFASPGSGGAWMWYSSIPKSKESEGLNMMRHPEGIRAKKGGGNDKAW
ncbi:unnamed protein product [marine sediment metagenome]|uniref:Uncharacterized protein n=1 Tax=marine sediment metagenome TaxID=412755 RepID=X1PCH8_9ZZZZ